MTAGPALARDHIAGFNCSYLPFDDPRAFDECLYILMCGAGVGFFGRTAVRQQAAHSAGIFQARPPRSGSRDSKMGLGGISQGWP